MKCQHYLVDDTYTLFASDTDGSNLGKIVEWEAASHFDVEGLSWSPDGARLLMFGRSTVGIVNVDGTEFRSFSIGDYFDGNVYASWSPDGSRIAIFTRLDRRDFNNGLDIVLFTMRPDGTDSRTLVKYTLDPDQLPNPIGEGRLEAARGEPVPSRFLEKITFPSPTSISLSSASATSSESRLVQRQNSPEAPLCDENSGNPCAPRDVSRFDLFSANSGSAAYDHGEASSVEGVLEDGLHLIGASPTHIAFRGTAQESGVRCAWRGVARTVGQREGAIRFWLGMDDNEPLASDVQVEAEFMSYINQTPPRYRDFVAASFIPVVRGGLSTERLTLTCYADYGVHEYLLGSGPAGTSTKLSVAYDAVTEARSYELYGRSHAAGEFGPATSTPLMSEGEYQAYLDRTVSEAESTLADILEGHQAVVFLAPMGAHNAIAVEAWQAVAQWDVQRADDGTVNAVRYGAHDGDPEHTQTLANLKSRVTAATTATSTTATSTAATTTRIASVSGLTQYYRDIGAYGDITPGDNATTTFTPAQPPSAYACATGAAVADPGANRALVHDCETLLESGDTLRGAGTLNWSASTAMADWEGVTVGGTPGRVAKLDLPGESLSGSIPPALGSLFELTHLDLSNNSLRGEIPRELGLLYRLESLRLSGNSLTGCIPVALRGVPTSDLGSLGLLYCRPPAPGGLRAGAPGQTSVPLTWNAVSDTGAYRVERRSADSAEWVVSDEAIGGTSHLVVSEIEGANHGYQGRERELFDTMYGWLASL